MKTDYLYHLMIEQINTNPSEPESHSELVKKVAANYLSHLLELGHIPSQMVQVVLEDLELEVLEMYRKKTYGSYSLGSYRGESKTKRKA